jgi:tripartite-type tricarboxylate transporter receptor subunit TctC
MNHANPFVRLARVACAAFLIAAASMAGAQSPNYPDHPIKLIVPVPPGGSTDALARIISVKLSENLGQQVVVENRPGAAGNVAFAIAAKTPPDGYTLLIVASNFVVNPGLYPQVAYDPINDFAPITYIASAPSLLVAHPSVPAKDLKELVALIKANPGKFNYASPGAGSAQHLAGEMFKLNAGVDITHIPFNGAGPAIASVLGSQVQLTFASLPAAQPHVTAGKLRAYAITNAVRSPAAPDVPTFIESGYPGVESDHLQGLLAPAGTPAPIIARLNSEMVKVINQPETRKRLIDLGFVPVGNSPEEFGAIIKFQIGKWSKLVKEAGIKAD